MVARRRFRSQRCLSFSLFRSLAHSTHDHTSRQPANATDSSAFAAQLQSSLVGATGGATNVVGVAPPPPILASCSCTRCSAGPIPPPPAAAASGGIPGSGKEMDNGEVMEREKERRKRMLRSMEGDDGRTSTSSFPSLAFYLSHPLSLAPSQTRAPSLSLSSPSCSRGPVSMLQQKQQPPEQQQPAPAAAPAAVTAAATAAAAASTSPTSSPGSRPASLLSKQPPYGTTSTGGGGEPEAAAQTQAQGKAARKRRKIGRDVWSSWSAGSCSSSITPCRTRKRKPLLQLLLPLLLLLFLLSLLLPPRPLLLSSRRQPRRVRKRRRGLRSRPPRHSSRPLGRSTRRGCRQTRRLPPQR